MKWIDSTDLRNWATRRDCQEFLPLLIRKLIRATSNSIQSIKFPSGESVLLGGWDGVLHTTDKTEYVPEGISVWEFGANRDVKEKADNDYEKRKKEPLGINPAESTFVFVTPRLWQNSDEWVEEKMKEKTWKDIRVINSELLEEWIDTAPSVGAWLAMKQLGKFPSEGIQPTEDFWDEWVAGTKFNLLPEILLGGRSKEKEQIERKINSASITAIQGLSEEESLAFTISCFKTSPEKEEDFFSRSLIVKTPEAFQELTLHDKPLILIPRFEDTGIMNRAIQKGHVVVAPIGADSSSSWGEKIILPKIDRDDFISALMKIGVTKEFAERFSKESARNITILRRQLGFTRTTPAWALPENLNEVIPALLIGRWDENYENDRRIISQIARDSYENYIKKLTRWLHISDAPIVKIGSSWRLTSPFDAWTYASRGITRHDFELLHKSALEVLTEVNPAFELDPDKRHMASLYGKNRIYSGWLREGLAQSLILTSIFGDKLQLDLPEKAELWVDRIISELLSSADVGLWKSLQNKLPLIAEASPTNFLGCIEKHLRENGVIAALFEEDPGFMTPTSYHTGLLWALENLAWFPQYLSRSALILARLAAIDPGGTLSNRPINSLSEIFKSWHPQTLAPFDERIEVLKLITSKELEVGWTILTKMLPDSIGGTAFPTHKARWRMFEFETEKPMTYKEIFDTHSTVVDLLISVFDFTESKFAKLIEESTNLSFSDQDKVLTFVESVISKVDHKKLSAWHATRRILYMHNSHPDAQWALSKQNLERYQKLYDALAPSDSIDKIKWIFDDSWPNFPEGYQHKEHTHDEQEKLIHKKRFEALNEIYTLYGLSKIFELSEKVKEGWALGDTLSYIIKDDKEIEQICELLQNDKVSPAVVQGFIFRKSILNSEDWVFVLFDKLKALNFDSTLLAKVLLPLNQNQKLWNFLESISEEISTVYWKKYFPRFYNLTTEEKLFGLDKLIQHKRYLSAVHICSHFSEEIPSNTILEVLKKAGTVISDEEQTHLDSYEVSNLFESLDKRSDYDVQNLLRLEWLYLPFLASYGNSRKPQRLHEELSRNPEFFMDVFKWIYKPTDETQVEDYLKDLSDEQIQNRAKQAFELLFSWKRIPGVDQDGKIDYDFLSTWIKRVRELAIEYGRVESADAYIGQVLAEYPEEKDKLWPPAEICNLIETLQSDSLNRNFSSATFNKRGFSSRGPFEGGNIERTKADYFRNLAQIHKNKYPTVTAIFEKLVKGYEADATEMDAHAERDNLEY